MQSDDENWWGYNTEVTLENLERCSWESIRRHLITIVRHTAVPFNAPHVADWLMNHCRPYDATTHQWQEIVFGSLSLQLQKHLLSLGYIYYRDAIDDAITTDDLEIFKFVSGQSPKTDLEPLRMLNVAAAEISWNIFSYLLEMNPGIEAKPIILANIKYWSVAARDGTVTNDHGHYMVNDKFHVDKICHFIDWYVTSLDELAANCYYVPALRQFVAKDCLLQHNHIHRALERGETDCVAFLVSSDNITGRLNFANCCYDVVVCDHDYTLLTNVGYDLRLNRRYPLNSRGMLFVGKTWGFTDEQLLLFAKREGSVALMYPYSCPEEKRQEYKVWTYIRPDQTVLFKDNPMLLMKVYKRLSDEQKKTFREGYPKEVEASDEYYRKMNDHTGCSSAGPTGPRGKKGPTGPSFCKDRQCPHYLWFR